MLPDRLSLGDRAHVITRAPWFQRTIIVSILFAGLLAGVETDAALMASHGEILRLLEWVVLGIFVAEIVLKIAACGRKPWHFFHDHWNSFDFVIVAICCLPLDTQFVTVLRLARSLRLLRLLSALPKLQLLVGALLKSLGAMTYVSLLLSLMFYIYAVAGVHLFGAQSPAHFGTLGAALLSLFQIVTLDNWSDILTEVRPGAPGPAIAYFVSFILLGTMIMMNLFIGIIMNSMSESHAEIEGSEAGKSGAVSALEEQIEELRGIVRDLSRATQAQKSVPGVTNGLNRRRGPAKR